MSITIKDIARRLDMNYSTVSYALSGKGSIKKETRELIRRTAAEMGYIPNLAARMISTGRSNLIGIAIPNVLFDYGEFCERTFRKLTADDYMTSVVITEFSPDVETKCISHLISQNLAGLIFHSAFHKLDIPGTGPALLTSRKIPAVIRNFESENFDCVNNDYYAIGKKIGKRLQARRRSRIVIAATHPAPFYGNILNTLQGVRDVLGPNASYEIIGMPFVQKDTEHPSANPAYAQMMHTILNRGGIDVGRRLFHRCFDNPEKSPDAVVCVHENCAVGLVLEAYAEGFLPPEKFSLVSVQNSSLSESSPCVISSVYTPAILAAEQSVNLLLKRITDPEAPHEMIWLKPSVISGATI